ncbi:MAG: class I SAM-dependent methyltransferase [Candidatus Omnitrophica bacterium]|nr:class I SAM-dependent methyltransferase [Candidatus Omnitrophota bacterium]MDD5652716.1 class I SAM-dependent methyltransferase [Candidatus Omnitrophota bacterium]
MKTISKIRELSIKEHDRDAAIFDEEYKNMTKNYYNSAFTYGRKKIETILTDNLRLLAPASKILDIGCGTGEQLKLCSRMGFDVTGVEPAENMRRIAKKNNPGTDVLNGTIINLPFSNNSFEAVLAIEVIRYLHKRDIIESYREMLRVLKPGGILFFTMVNLFALDGFYVFDKFKKLCHNILKLEEPAHCEFTTPWRVQKDLEALKIKDIKIQGVLFAPLRIIYKFNHNLGAYAAKITDKFENYRPIEKYMVPFAGHLIVLAKRPLDE